MRATAKPLLGQPWVKQRNSALCSWQMSYWKLKTMAITWALSLLVTNSRVKWMPVTSFLFSCHDFGPGGPFVQSPDTCSLPRSRWLHCAAGGFPLQGLSSCTAHKITMLFPLMTASLLWLWWWMSSKHTTKLIQPYGRLSLEAENYKNRLILITALRLIGKSHSQKETIMTLT